MARTRTASRYELPLPVSGLSKSFSVRLLQKYVSEQTLRRLIPYLLIIFFITLLLGTLAHFYTGKETATNEAKLRISLFADVIAAKLQATSDQQDDVQVRLANILPAGTTAQQRQVLLTDETGKVVAAAPITLAAPETPLVEILGKNQLITTFGETAGVMRLQIADGRDALVTLRSVAGTRQQVTLIQPINAALSDWRRSAAVEVTLSLTAAIVLLLLGTSFRWFSERVSTAELERSVAQRDLSVTLEKTGLGLCDWNLSRGHVRLSGGLREMLSLDRDTEWLPFSTFAELFRSGDDFYSRANSAIETDQKSFGDTLELEGADGNTREFSLNCNLVRDEVSGEKHLVMIFDDASAIDTAQAGTNGQLRDAIEAISEAFVLWDKENRLVMCNSKYQQFYKLDDSSILPGTPYDTVIADATEPVVRASTITQDNRLVNASGSHRYEAQLEDGRWLQIDERRTKDGGFVSIGTDITSLKKSQKRQQKSETALKGTITDLRASRRELEQQKQQLVDLMEKYALETNRAEAANRAKSEFLANISHELRTPLNAVIGFSEVMQNGLFGPMGNKKYVEYARDIHESGRFLLEVINDILDMSKIEAGRFSLELNELDVAEIIRDSVRVVGPAAAERSIEVKCTGLKTLSLQADKRALKQILLNLLSNAVKFTPQDGVVTVRATKAKGEAKISIKDTGIGIPDSELDKLGRPFEQVENQFTKSHRGSGLGLAISRSLVELHGGCFEIASEEGKGTTVTCRLPLKPVEPGKESQAA